MTRKQLRLVAFATLALASPAMAQEVGQFAVAVIPPQPNQNYSQALISMLKMAMYGSGSIKVQLAASPPFEH
jgi:ABC-type sugar transport system substrate-binding protein